jgi:predicted nucleic acid-binding protein
LTWVVDASVVISALIEKGPKAAWAEEVLATQSLFGPHLLPVEVAHAIRSAALSGDITPEHATGAHNELRILPVALLPYEGVADRVWQLRSNVTPYDAWYVAIAEDLGVPLATLDGNLMRSPGPRCEFVTFEG